MTSDSTTLTGLEKVLPALEPALRVASSQPPVISFV